MLELLEFARAWQVLVNELCSKTEPNNCLFPSGPQHIHNASLATDFMSASKHDVPHASSAYSQARSTRAAEFERSGLP